jgi:hypothetical protein
MGSSDQHDETATLSGAVAGIAELLILIEQNSDGSNVAQMRSHGSRFSAEYAALGAVPVIVSVDTELNQCGVGAVLPRGQVMELSLFDGRTPSSSVKDVVEAIHRLDAWAQSRVTEDYLALYRPFAEQSRQLRNNP